MYPHHCLGGSWWCTCIFRCLWGAGLQNQPWQFSCHITLWANTSLVQHGILLNKFILVRNLPTHFFIINFFYLCGVWPRWCWEGMLGYFCGWAPAVVQPLGMTKRTCLRIGWYGGRVCLIGSGFWCVGWDAVDFRANFSMRIGCGMGVGGITISFGVKRVLGPRPVM